MAEYDPNLDPGLTNGDGEETPKRRNWADDSLDDPKFFVPPPPAAAEQELPSSPPENGVQRKQKQQQPEDLRHKLNRKRNSHQHK